METTSIIKNEYNMYLNEEKFEPEYIDDEALIKASQEVHQFFDREITIRLSNGYALVFDPVGQSSSYLVSKILSTDVENLQNFIQMLRFRRIRIKSPLGIKRKNKVANCVFLKFMKIHDKCDIDGFTSYNPNFIVDTLKEFKKEIMNMFEKGDFSDYQIKLKPEEKLHVYILFQEVYYILNLFY